MIIVMQCVIRYAIAQIDDIDITLSNLGLLFLILATVLIAAGGYIINDSYDVVADKINKPKKRTVGVTIDEKQAKLIYFGLTFTGLGLGFILTSLMGHPIYFIYFLLSAGFLYLYARFIKKYALIGNLLVSILVGLSVILVPLFELIPAIDTSNNEEQLGAFTVFTSVAIFAFAITLIRELVKDIEDIQGDHVAGYKTLPILLGAQRTARVSVILTLIIITFISWYTFTFLYDYKIAVATVFFAIITPLGYCCSKLWEATKKSELSHISLILKVIMFVGICIIPLLIHAIYYA